MSRRHKSDDWGIFGTGPYRVEVCVGAKANRQRVRQRFPAGTKRDVMRAWRNRALLQLEAVLGPKQPLTPETLSSGIGRYVREADLTPSTRQDRTRQLAWWEAQAAALGAPVLTPAQVRAGSRVSGETLGGCLLRRLDPKRLRECLQVAFAPSDPARNPTEFASTSNKYRTALSHLFTVLFQDDVDAPRSPLASVHERVEKGAAPSGQDMRVIVELLKHAAPHRKGRNAKLEARLGALAWVHITPRQLGQLRPADFHDVLDATREEMVAGLITVTKRPRLKGRTKRTIPSPETIPLTPYGVAALRAVVAADAWGMTDTERMYLNRRVQIGARRAQAVFAARGLTLDLSGFTLYHFKHSLATAAAVASGGVMNRDGVIQQSPGVQRALDHAAPQMTAIYTQAAIDPILRQVNAALSLHLDRLFRTPLTGLRLARGARASKGMSPTNVPHSL